MRREKKKPGYRAERQGRLFYDNTQTCDKQYFDTCLGETNTMPVHLCILSVVRSMFYMPLHFYLTGSHTVPAEDQLSGSC